MKFSKRWSPETKESVSHSKINLITVYDNTDVNSEVLNILNSNHLTEAHHCDFCGQRIKYTSVLKLTKNSIVTHFQIGKECLIYMDDHDLHVEGYKEVKTYVTRIVKDLVEKNKVKNRQIKYSSLHTDVLSWMKDNMSFVKKNRFLSDMYIILTTGKKVYTKNMDFYVKSCIEKCEVVKQLNLHPKDSDALGSKIQKVLYLMSSYGEITIGASFDVISFNQNKKYVLNDYNFGLSIYKYFLNKNSISPKQSEAMNKLYKRYVDYLKKPIVVEQPSGELLPF